MNISPSTSKPATRRVYKLGGGTVADARCIRNTLAAIPWAQHPIVVVSAPAGITDRLNRAVDQLFHGHHREFRGQLNAIVGFYQQLATQLLDTNTAHAVTAPFITWAREVSVEATRARLLARGELWNAALIAAYLRANDHPAWNIDARHFIRAEQGEGDASIEAIAEHLPPPGTSAIIGGFIARDRQGRTLTLGRDGSDYSAALIAEAVRADTLCLFTDTPGIRSADPRLLGHAGQRIRCIGHREARTLVNWGGGVLHPRTIRPLMRAAITAHIGLPGDDDHVTRLVPGSHWPSGGLGLFRYPIQTTDIAASTSTHTATEACSDTVDTTADNAPTPRVVIPLPKAQPQPISGNPRKPGMATRRVEQQAQHELQRSATVNAFRRYWPQTTCYGDGLELPLPTTPSADSHASVNSLLQEVHQRLYESPQSVQLILYGPGQVGGEVLRQLQQADFQHRLDYGLALDVVRVIDSRGSRWSTVGIDIADSGPSQPLTLRHSDSGTPVIVIDTTASPAIADHHRGWLEQGLGVVTANKYSLSADHDTAQRLLGDAWFGANTTVGAGLPFLKTLLQRQRQGRVPRRFQAVLSGSVNDLLDQLHHGAGFESALHNAQHQGLLEPDPSADLQGWDSARKLLILARALGFRGDLRDVRRQPLFHQADASDLKHQHQQATRRGETLRYIATWRAGHEHGDQLHLAPASVPRDSPLAVPGCHNVLVLDNDDDSSEIISGPGAGPVVTAQGVIRDILHVAQHMIRQRTRVRAA